VRVFHKMSVVEATEVVEALTERTAPIIWTVGGVRRVLDPDIGHRDQALILLYASTGWVPVAELAKSIEVEPRYLRRDSLQYLHDQRLIELNSENDSAMISPRGIYKVESNGLLQIEF